MANRVHFTSLSAVLVALGVTACEDPGDHVLVVGLGGPMPRGGSRGDGSPGDAGVVPPESGLRDVGAEVAPRDASASLDGDALAEASPPGDADASPDSLDAALPVPTIVSAPWTVAHDPDLGALTGPYQQVVDFGVWQAGDGTWQLWSCIRQTLVGGNTRLFYRWEAQNLTDPDWTPLGIAMEADPSLGETEGGLQAPFVTKIGAVWHMVYGDWEHVCHATSTDGKTFTRVVGADGTTGLFTEGLGLNTRDPMLLREGAVDYLYYTASTGTDYVRTSSDLVTFSASTTVAYGGAAGPWVSAAECPFVVHPDPSGPYLLLRTQRYGAGAETRVYRSYDPTYFGIDDDAHYLVETLPVAAPEIVKSGSEYFIAYLLEDLHGIQIARMTF